MNIFPNINQFWANLMIEELVRNGVENFFISPGSRSSPLTLAVASNKKAKSYIHFDERGNAFRALGHVTATKQPSAIITTSGTAAANLFPAIIEASKKKVPLIILTADRPPELRFTGAHQTIDQTKIYGEYVRWNFDMPCPTSNIAPEFVLTTIDQAISRAKGNPAGPVHINCMYREPLVPINDSVRAGFKPVPTYLNALHNWQNNHSPYTQYVSPKSSLDQNEIKDIAAKIKKIKNGIIVVGKLSIDSISTERTCLPARQGSAFRTESQEQINVLKLAEQLNWPVFADISSGLRLGNDHKNIIHYFDQILLSDEFQKKYRPDGILHLGGRITSKRWYEYVALVKPAQYIMTLNHPLRSDPLHNVTTRIQCNIALLTNALVKHIPQRGNNKHLSLLQKCNTCVDQNINHFLEKQTEISEPQTARLITQYIPANSGLYVSSSMPIREIDMVGAPNHKPVVFGANRGASGIDGTIATAIGFATGLDKPTTLLIGDLAFLHDINSLAMLRECPTSMVIVILNNNGGGIFSFLPFKNVGKDFERYFGTPHHLTFHSAADLFDLNYARAENAHDFAQTYSIALKSQSSTIIEIQTDRSTNLKLHKDLQNEIRRTIQTNIKYKPSVGNAHVRSKIRNAGLRSVQKTKMRSKWQKQRKIKREKFNGYRPANSPILNMKK